MRTTPRAAALAALTFVSLTTPAVAATTPGLDAWRVTADAKTLKALAIHGFDVTEGVDRETGKIDVVGTPDQIAAAKVDAERLTDDGAQVRVARAANATADASDAAWDVWTKYDAVPGDGKEQYTEQYDRIVAEHPQIAARRSFGTTYEGREIVALQITKGATGQDVPGRPAVLYNAMQHAREWLAGETCRRTLDHFVDNYGKTTSAGKQVTRLVDTTELWFVCVNNPDGYEYTFTGGASYPNRLWRKNLRDNDASGTIEPGDGVDPNRNFSQNWGRDDEGSSPDPASETYRGPSAASEPETKAMEALFAEVRPVFQKNDHTAAQLLLYPQGFQQDTETADDPIFSALAGDPFTPAIDGFLPELSAGLYITNGDFTDWAYTTQDTLSFTPEGTEREDGSTGSGFEYEDSPLRIRQEFHRHLPFVLDLAESADTPDRPVSHLDNEVPDFVVDAFARSTGDPQVVQTKVKRSLGDVELHWRVNGGQELKVPATHYGGGETYDKEKGVFFHRVRGVISGTKPGDRVQAWFEAGGKQSERFTYEAVSDTGRPVLLLSDEDWSGVQPNPAPLAGPQFLAAHKAALDAAGVPYDVYDVSALRQAPDPLGVLAHYSHVVWYSGADFVTREPDAPGGSGTSKLAVEVQNAVRDFINDGGRVFYSGQAAGAQFALGYQENEFQREEGTYCQADGGGQFCRTLQDDFLQYWLGAGLYVPGGAADPDGEPLPIKGVLAPFTLGETPVAGTASSLAPTLLTTSSLLPPDRYPALRPSRKVLDAVRPGAAPYQPFEGSWFVGAGADDAAYKRLLVPVDLTGKSDATFSFRTSYDLEADYDYLFVEAHTAGQDDWTTLAAPGHTSDDVGLSCPATGDGSDWQSLHPFLAHYQTKTDQGAHCSPTGTSGSWNAATGNSGGWQEWEVPIPAAFLNKQVELSITVASDPAVRGLGAWVDAAKVVAGGTEVVTTGFESGLAPFVAAPPPAGTAQQEPTWTRAQDAPFVEGPGVATDDTVFLGFGLEQVGEAARVELVKSAFAALGTPAPREVDAPTPVVVPAPGGGNGGGGGNGSGGSSGAPAPAGGTSGTPIPVGTTPPRPVGLTRLGASARRLATVLRKRGLPIAISCAAQCTATVEVRVSAATRRRLGLRSTRLGRRTALLSPRTRSMTVPFSATTLRKLRRAKAFGVSVQATVRGAQNARRTTRLTLR